MICRFCAGQQGEVVLDLGETPACDDFPSAADPGPDATYPLRMWLCADCGLAQLTGRATPAEQPLGTEPEALVQQARRAIEVMSEAGVLPAGASVAEFGSPHGGSWLAPLAERGITPAAGHQPASVVLDCFGLMHEPDQREALRRRVARLAPEGTLLIQFHPLSTIIRLGQWNALRHGHYAYYSSTVLIRMLAEFGLRPATARHFDLYGGTVLLVARRDAGPDAEIDRLLAEDTDTADGLRALAEQVDTSTEALRRWLAEARAEGRTVLGYGAASRAVALLYAAGVGPETLPAIADASPAKHGRRMPGSRVPVISPDELADRDADEVLLFLPDLLDEVRTVLPSVARWVIAEPVPTPVQEPVRSIGAPDLIGDAVAPLTVGLPVYNGERYLAQTLASLVEQEGVDFRLLIADNASTDGTEAMCRELAARDPRVDYLRRERNVGVTANHNLLVEQASSPLFMWAAADDRYQPKRLSACVSALDRHPEAVLAFTAAQQIDERGRVIGSWHNPCRTDHPDPVVRLSDLISMEHENYHCYGVFRRDVLLRTRLLPPVKNNDRILIAELALHGPFAEIDDELLIHRLHENRLTHSVSSRDWYRTQRTDGRRIVLPNVEEAGWYLGAVRRAPLRRRDRARALLALRPWFSANALPMARNVARAAVDGVRTVTGKSG